MSCIQHNILLEHDGYLAESFSLSITGSLLAKLVIPGDRGDGLQMRTRHKMVVHELDGAELDGDDVMAAEWKQRILAISEHIERKERVHL
jgi:hypothetical protein